MEITDSKKNNWLVLNIEGRLDTVTAPDFDKYIATVDNSEVNIALEMSALSYLSSAGLRCLLKLSKALSVKNGSLVLASPTEMVQEVLEESGLDSLLDVVDSVDDLK